MLQSLLFLNALCFGVGMPLVCQENTQDIQDKVEFYQDNRKFVSYDDETYTITLTADELNNYSWQNLNTLFVFYAGEGLDFGSVFNSVEYNDQLVQNTGDIFFNLEGDNNDFACFQASTSNYEISYNYDYLEDELIGDYKFKCYYSGDFGLFQYSIDFVCNSVQYTGFKQAIELDIQANSNPQPHLQPVLTELVSLLTAGITSLASGIGQGVSTLVSDIFINNGALSTFGAVICIFGGIALAIGLSRWVMNFLTSLGAKK